MESEKLNTHQFAPSFYPSRLDSICKMRSCVFKPNETVLPYLYSDVNGNTSNNVKCPDWRIDGDKAIAATSFATFFLNVIVAVVLGYMLKQKMTNAKVHLFILAFSDMSVGAVMILGAFLDWF